MAEFWNIYDEKRRDTGRIAERGSTLNPNEFHLVVNAWLRNGRGEYLLSRRAAGKSDPLKWETTGGSALASETSLLAAVREVKEELGIDVRPRDGVLVCSGIRRYEGSPDILDVWLFDGYEIPLEEVTLQQEETCAAKWASIEEIRRMIHSGEWIPMEKFNYLDKLGI